MITPALKEAMTRIGHMKTYFLNPHLRGRDKYIREGRCMQKVSSWVTIWPPIGLATLATIAQKKGEVRLVDGNVEDLSEDSLLRDIGEFAPDLLVINTGFPSIESDMDVARRIKEAYPHLRLLAFGLYFVLVEEAAFRAHPCLDFAILGEPEETFAQLLDAMEAEPCAYDQVKGIAFRQDADVTITLARPLIANLDTVPFPDRRLLQCDRYRLPHNDRPFTLINSARGCPHECVYCVVPPFYGHRVRRHSIDYVLAEIRECVEMHGIHEILFWEEVFTLDRQRALALCDGIRREGLPIHWAATTRVDCVDDELLRVMKQAGCYLLGLGVESGVQALLDGAKKRMRLADTRAAVDLCRKAGIQTMGHFIFGLPGETQETAEQTIRFMLELGLDYMQAYCAVPYPRTELGEWATRNERVQAQRWSAYDFGGASICHTGTLTPAEVSRLRQKAFRAFYFRSAVLWRLLWAMGFWRLCRLSRFLGWMNAGEAEVPAMSDVRNSRPPVATHAGSGAECLVSIVMPCLNEEPTLASCVQTALTVLQGLHGGGEVLVVDNGSTDGSAAIAEELGARVVSEPVRGYGSALRRGIREARGKYVVVADADGTYDLSRVAGFVTLLEDGWDLVMGNRLAGHIAPGAMPWLHRWAGTPALTFLLNRLYGVRVSDINCGMRGFRKAAVEVLGLECNGMEFASEMLMKAGQKGLRIGEVPIDYYAAPVNRTPKLRTFCDGWRHLRLLLLGAPQYIFFYPGMLVFLLGLFLTVRLLLAETVILHITLGLSTAVFANGCLLIGVQMMLFGGCALAFDSRDLSKLDRISTFLRQKFTLEKGLMAGAAILATGLILGAIIVICLARLRLDPSEVSTRLTKLAALAVFITLAGTEILFSSMYLGLRDRDRTLR